MGINPIYTSKGRKDGKDHIVKNFWYIFLFYFYQPIYPLYYEIYELMSALLF